MWKPQCKGPNKKHVAAIRAQIEASELLIKFHQLPAKKQEAFVALFNSMDDEE